MKQLKTTNALIISLVAALAVGGCASSMSGGAYSRSQARQAQEVQLGTVESVRNVQIEGTKTPIGTLTGAALGGIAGSMIGQGTRANTAGAIGGAVLGGMAGSAVEEGVTRQQGIEVTVRLDNGRMVAITQGADQPFAPGDRVKVVTAPDGTSRVTY